MTLIAFALSLILPAQAGKLADGFRGLPFGDASVVADKPLDDCQPGGLDGLLWVCTSTIGSTPVSVSYMGSDGLFSGVYITAEGSQHRAPLLAVLQGAWGDGLDGGHRIDRLWRDGSVLATYKHNKYSGQTTVVLFDQKVSEKQKKMAAARAQEAAQGDL